MDLGQVDIIVSESGITATLINYSGESTAYLRMVNLNQTSSGTIVECVVGQKLIGFPNLTSMWAVLYVNGTKASLVALIYFSFRGTNNMMYFYNDSGELITTEPSATLNGYAHIYDSLPNFSKNQKIALTGFLRNNSTNLYVNDEQEEPKMTIVLDKYSNTIDVELAPFQFVCTEASGVQPTKITVNNIEYDFPVDTNIDITSGINVKIANPNAPEITVDYTNTSEPVITNTERSPSVWL